MVGPLLSSYFKLYTKKKQYPYQVINHVMYCLGAYGKWANLQPDNDGNNQYCGAMDTHNSANLTIDEECDISYPYVCQIGND